MEKKIVAISEDSLNMISGGNSDEKLSSKDGPFEVTCCGCGGIALVPFKPRRDRPVYCTDCWNSLMENK